MLLLYCNGFLILANVNLQRSVDQDFFFAFKYLSYLLTFKKKTQVPRAITATWLCTPDSDPAVT